MARNGCRRLGGIEGTVDDERRSISEVVISGRGKRVKDLAGKNRGERRTLKPNRTSREVLERELWTT